MSGVRIEEVTAHVGPTAAGGSGGVKFYLVRHGETEWNKSGRFQGQYDTALNETGLAQARATAAAAVTWGLTALYSSPLSRTMGVAAEFTRQLGLPANPKDGLKELALGQLEGVTGEEMRAGWPHVFDTWRDHPELTEMPGGESLAQLQERSWQVILELEQAHAPEDNLALISHNFTIRAICGKLLGMPLTTFHRMHLALGSVSVFDSNPRGRRLLTYNSTAHLSPDNASRPA